MEPEEPSRYSKPNTDPVTIDLKAEEVGNIPQSEAEGTEEDISASSAAEPVLDATETAEPPANETAADEGSGEKTELGKNQSATSSRKADGGKLPLVAAGLVGGVVTVVALMGLQYWGILPAPGNGKTDEAVVVLSSQISGLKGKLDTLEASQPEQDLTPITTKLKALEDKMANMPAANGLTADADARISALNEQIAKATATQQDLAKATETANAALIMRLEALEKKVNAPRDDVQVALAIASAGLKAAIDRGGPFMSELETLANISPDDPAIKELKTFAATGVPSRANIVNDFPGVADQILGAINAADPNESITDRLIAGAMSVIKIRPVGNVEGVSPDAIVARMEDKLKNGDLKGAALEWNSLPDLGKKASADFKKSLDARIRVEDLVGSTLSRAVGSQQKNG